MAPAAYRNAEQMMASSNTDCGISWNLLAGIGRIESGHANGGATNARGTAVRPIYGPRWMARCPETRSLSKAVPAVKSTTRAQWARCSSSRAPGWQRLLSVDGHHDAAIQAIFRPHADHGVGAILHDGPIGGLVVPLLDYVEVVDGQRGVDSHSFADFALESRDSARSALSFRPRVVLRLSRRGIDRRGQGIHIGLQIRGRKLHPSTVLYRRDLPGAY